MKVIVSRVQVSSQATSEISDMVGYQIRATAPMRESDIQRVSALFLYDSTCTLIPVQYWIDPIEILPVGITVTIGFSVVSRSVVSARVFVCGAKSVDHPKYH